MAKPKGPILYRGTSYPDCPAVARALGVTRREIYDALKLGHYRGEPILRAAACRSAIKEE